MILAALFAPFMELQRLQLVTRFSSSSPPPSDFGRMWSTLKSSDDPQYTQTRPSRAKIFVRRGLLILDDRV